MFFDIYPLIRPLLFRLDAETAHGLAIGALKNGLVPRPAIEEEPLLRTRVFGLSFETPIGLAAGFDKQAEVIQPMLDLGFAFVEAGGVVPLSQPGNPKPRLFRVAESEAVINRFNFNSVGFEECARRVAQWRAKNANGILGINIAKGDQYEDAAAAYIFGLQTFAPYVDFVTINVSCPNSPDARNLEGRDQLKELLTNVMDAHGKLFRKPQLLVKISPDQSDKQAEDIADVALASGIDGMIVGNTTAARPASVTSATGQEKGGLSGRPLFEMSTRLLGKMYGLTQGKLPLIGTGGVFSGADAYAKIRAGATLVQLYTAMVYKGPYIAVRIAAELAELLRRDGFAAVGEAVGADFRK